MEEVMAATTLPVLLLGGDPDGPAAHTYARWQAALALPGVRGFVVGRALLYPEDGDIAAAVDAACALVHP
jgi:DhnA family fructose-bisphosphate aldolase class Ia